MSGLFITFEGGEGGGKSTQLTRLKNWLANREPGREIVTTREPGGTVLAESIRDILIKGRADKMTVQTEALLMIAARADHVTKIIKPAKKRDAIILCDRFSDSTLVYQGLAQGVAVDELQFLHQFAFGDIKPDITFLLDVQTGLGLKRAKTRFEDTPLLNAIENIDREETRFENKGAEFHKRVRASFLTLAEQDKRFITINAHQTEEAIEAEIQSHIKNKLRGDK